MTDTIRVATDSTLLSLLEQRLNGWSRKKLKERLRAGCVTVNGVLTTQHDHALCVDDEIVIVPLNLAAATNRKPAQGRLHTVFADDDIIAIDKPSGLLSVGTRRERDKTALARVRQSLGSRARLWPVHRLDRETSGVLVFATTKEAREGMQAGWSEAEKTYLAIVHGRVAPDHGVVETALWEDRNLFVHTSAHPPPQAKSARTFFEVQQRRGDRTLLRVRLDTGRKHQIRVHLLSIGHPVVGDARYASSDLRLGLHALHLSVQHPRTGERLELHAEPPDAFRRLLR